PPDPEPAIELLQGRVVIRQPGASALKVAFGRDTIRLEMSSDTVLGMERVDRNKPGQPVTVPQSLGVLCLQGEVSFDFRGKKQQMKATDVALLEPDGQAQRVTRDAGAMPPWLTETEASPYEVQVREQFVKLFHADRNVLTEMVGAVEDSRRDMKQLAVIA